MHVWVLTTYRTKREVTTYSFLKHIWSIWGNAALKYIFFSSASVGFQKWNVNPTLYTEITVYAIEHKSGFLRVWQFIFTMGYSTSGLHQAAVDKILLSVPLCWGSRLWNRWQVNGWKAKVHICGLADDSVEILWVSTFWIVRNICITPCIEEKVWKLPNNMHCCSL